MIEIKNATKYFKLENERKYIFKNVNLMIPEGLNVGILGRNGAGKSTLLRILGGIDFPTSGEIVSDKSFSWPMGLAGGFQGSMTGRQNVKFVCRIYGKSSDEINKAIKFIKDFSELGHYFDRPIKTYSSGMKSKLSFGLSLAFDFDYLIIDETLSVGDEYFKNKAKKALQEKIERSNILLVSHSMSTLREMCDAGIVVHDGTIQYYEKIEDAINAYHALNSSLQAEAASKPKQNATASSAIYCSDGNVFDNINEAAKFYKLRPISIVQALNENNGSNVYLKKVFYRDGHVKPSYQEWKDIKEKETIISSDGVIFKDHTDAAAFYMDRLPKAGIDLEHIKEIMIHDGFSKKLNVQFYYLSEYK